MRLTDLIDCYCKQQDKMEAVLPLSVALPLPLGLPTKIPAPVNLPNQRGLDLIFDVHRPAQL